MIKFLYRLGLVKLDQHTFKHIDDQDFLLEIAFKERNVYTIAIDKLTNQNHLQQIAKEHEKPAARGYAFRKITDEGFKYSTIFEEKDLTALKLFANHINSRQWKIIALEHQNSELRKYLLDKIENQTDLQDFVRRTKHGADAIVALSKIADEKLLSQLLESDSAPSWLKEITRERLAVVTPEKVKSQQEHLQKEPPRSTLTPPVDPKFVDTNFKVKLHLFIDKNLPATMDEAIIHKTYQRTLQKDDNYRQEMNTIQERCSVDAAITKGIQFPNVHSNEAIQNLLMQRASEESRGAILGKTFKGNQPLFGFLTGSEILESDGQEQEVNFCLIYHVYDL